MKFQSTFGSAGIGFRIQNNRVCQSYTFFISANGTCSAADRTGSSFFNTICSSVHQGTNAINTLTINQQGVHMDFYVNGTLVGSANDGTFSAGGIALATDGKHTNVVFSNFTLTKWE